MKAIQKKGRTVYEASDSTLNLLPGTIMMVGIAILMVVIGLIALYNI